MGLVDLTFKQTSVAICNDRAVCPGRLYAPLCSVNYPYVLREEFRHSASEATDNAVSTCGMRVVLCDILMYAHAFIKPRTIHV